MARLVCENSRSVLNKLYCRGTRCFCFPSASAVMWLGVLAATCTESKSVRCTDLTGRSWSAAPASDVRKCCSHVLDWSSCLWLVSDLWPGPEPASRGRFSRAPLITECKTTIRSCDRSAWCKEIFKRALLTCLSGCQSSSSQTWSLCS